MSTKVQLGDPVPGRIITVRNTNEPVHVPSDPCLVPEADSVEIEVPFGNPISLEPAGMVTLVYGENGWEEMEGDGDGD